MLSNADYANNSSEIVAVMREQRKEGADFTKIYETGRDSLQNGVFTTPFQYTEAELAAAFLRLAAVAGNDTYNPAMPYLAVPISFAQQWLQQAVDNATGVMSGTVVSPSADTTLVAGHHVQLHLTGPCGAKFVLTPY